MGPPEHWDPDKLHVDGGNRSHVLDQARAVRRYFHWLHSTRCIRNRGYLDPAGHADHLHAGTILVGLATLSHHATLTTTATYDNVTVQ